jgi:hypothetical protein
MRLSGTLIVVLVPLVLAGCGGTSQDWNEEFTSQVNAVIDSAEKVHEATRSVDGPGGLRAPFARFSEELLPVLNRMEELEPAPKECASAQRLALASMRALVLLGRESSTPRDFTPELLKNAKAHPTATVETLERALSKARC